MSLSRKEVLLWCALGAAVLTAILLTTGGARPDNDSFQYLSAAENINAGHGASTSIVGFDAERMSGRVPAPLTTFPPGYPLAVALVSRLGTDSLTAATLISMVSFVALFPLLARGARILELERNLTRLVFAWLLVNSFVAKYPLQVGTESTFTALSTGAVVVLMAAERRGETAPRRLRALVLGSLLVGLAYWVRYAGLFLFAAVTAYFALHALLRRDRRSLQGLGCCAVPLVIIGLGFARNLFFTSSWQGGNTKKVFHPVLPMLKEFVQSIYHLLFGDKVAVRIGAAEVMFAAATLALGLLAVHAMRREPGEISAKRPVLRAPETPFRGPIVLLVWYLAVYCVAMVYAGVVTVISFSTRMFYPILPLLLLALGHLLGRIGSAVSATSARQRVFVASTVVLTACYLAINARSIAAGEPPGADQRIGAHFAEAAGDGRPLRAWVDENVPADAVIVATEVNATAHVLKRKAVALTESEYSDAVWSESEVAALMAVYHADFLTLYPTARSSASAAQRESPFLAGLLEGRLPPWLRLEAENRHVKVFRRLSALEARVRN